MDIPAFSLAALGLYFFIRFSQTSSNKYLYLFAACYSLAGLFKISSLLSFMAVLGMFGLELVNVRICKDRRIFPNPISQSVPLILVVLVQIAWYLYANSYNSQYNKGFFLIGILPIWDMGPDRIRELLSALVIHTKWDYFRWDTQLVFVGVFIFNLVFIKKLDRMIATLLILTSIGFLSFVILFFQPLEDHDYYTINLFIHVPVVFLGFLIILKNRFGRIYGSLLLKIALIAFLIHNANFAASRIHGRYDPDGWRNKDYFQTWQTFIEISPYLRSMGIEEDDPVLSLSDPSINITLYMMNQQGWTNYGIHSDSIKIEEKIRMGARYLILLDTGAENMAEVTPFMKSKIGTFKNIEMYDLK